MKLLVKSGCETVLFIIMTFFLVSPLLSFASQWVNPRDQFKDVNEVRLQQGKMELSEIEKQEVKKYGSTALELMTYLFFNQEPGDHDYDSCWNIYNIASDGRILKTVAIDKNIYRLKNNKVDLVTLNGIKPGDVWRR